MGKGRQSVSHALPVALAFLIHLLFHFLLLFFFKAKQFCFQRKRQKGHRCDIYSHQCSALFLVSCLLLLPHHRLAPAQTGQSVTSGLAPSETLEL